MPSIIDLMLDRAVEKIIEDMDHWASDFPKLPAEGSADEDKLLDDLRAALRPLFERCQ